MKTLKNHLFSIALFSAFIFSCNKEAAEPTGNINDPNVAQGSLSVSITDAPIDQTNITGAFITVTEIQIDGKVFTGFKGPKTINVLELQNGNSLNLGEGIAAAGAYSTLKLVVNTETDAAGNAPGCYLSKTDGTKEKLEISGNGKTEIDLKPKNFTISESGKTEIVMDFDLRKSIKSKNNDYSFVTLGELKSSVRAENKSTTGTISGKINNYSLVKSDVVVYAYQKGTFKGSTEIKGQGASEVKFANAVTSAKVDAGGNFTLSFLPIGDYEIYCEKPDNSPTFGLGINTLLEVTSSTDIKAVGVSAGAKTSLALNVKLGGILTL